MNTEPTPFWVDRDYDCAHASDGISRYGAYLRDATFEPWTDHDQAVEWAAFAWRRATGPVMSPATSGTTRPCWARGWSAAAGTGAWPAA